MNVRAMCDARCTKCNNSFGWCGSLRDRPNCPRCGDPGDREQIERDAVKFDAILKRMEMTAAQAVECGELAQARVSAALPLGSAAIKLGVDIPTLQKIESGEIPIPDNLADKIAELYGIKQGNKVGALKS